MLRLADRLSPEVMYQSINNFKAGVGTFLIWGEERTLFNSWDELNQIFARFRLDF